MATAVYYDPEETHRKYADYGASDKMYGNKSSYERERRYVMDNLVRARHLNQGVTYWRDALVGLRQGKYGR